MKPPVAVANTGCSQIAYPHLQRGLVPGGTAAVVAGTLEANRLASAPFTDLEADTQKRDLVQFLDRLYSFFRIRFRQIYSIILRYLD